MTSCDVQVLTSDRRREAVPFCVVKRSVESKGIKVSEKADFYRQSFGFSSVALPTEAAWLTVVVPERAQAKHRLHLA